MSKESIEGFQVGDAVTLIIGGPEMVIEVIDQDDVAFCVWFNDISELQKDRFHVNFLQLSKNGKIVKI